MNIVVVMVVEWHDLVSGVPVDESFIDAQVSTDETFIIVSELDKNMVEVWKGQLIFMRSGFLHPIADGRRSKFEEHAICASWNRNVALADCEFNVHIVFELHFPIDLLDCRIVDAKAVICLYSNLRII